MFLIPDLLDFYTVFIKLEQRPGLLAIRRLLLPGTGEHESSKVYETDQLIVYGFRSTSQWYTGCLQNQSVTFFLTTEFENSITWVMSPYSKSVSSQRVSERQTHQTQFSAELKKKKKWFLKFTDGLPPRDQDAEYLQQWKDMIASILEIRDDGITLLAESSVRKRHFRNKKKLAQNLGRDLEIYVFCPKCGILVHPLWKQKGTGSKFLCSKCKQCWC